MILEHNVWCGEFQLHKNIHANATPGSIYSCFLFSLILLYAISPVFLELYICLFIIHNVSITSTIMTTFLLNLT
jgi:hypothetical protein